MRAVFRSACGMAGFILLCGNLLAQKPDTKPTVGITQHPIADYAIVNTKIVPEPGKSIEKGTIVIRDGKIAEVGENVLVPADVKVIDLSGKTIYPGFVDAGVEFDLPTPEGSRGVPHWNSEVTPEKSVAELTGPSAATLTKLKRAGIGAALVAPNSGIIKGKSAVVLTGDDSLVNSMVKPDVAMHVRLTVSRGGARGNYPSSPMGAVALARQTFLDASWYEKAWRAYRAAAGLPQPENNSALEAIVQHSNAGKIFVFDALNEQYVLRADSFAREFGLNAVIRASGQEYQLLDLVAKTQRPMIVGLNFPKPPNVATHEAALDAELEELMHWELAPENPGRLAKAGVKIVLTTQGLNDPAEFINQIRKAIKRGLDPIVALQAITTTPASLLGVQSEVGTISTGAWANLVVASGDLWDDKTKIDEVWVAGVRPTAAFKQDVGVDGKWSLTSVGSSDSKWPSALTLNVADSTKRVSATLELVKKPDSKVSKPEEPKAEATKDNKPEEKPAETKPVDTKPADAKLVETKPADEKQPDAKPTDEKATADKADGTNKEVATESAKKPDEKKPESGKSKLNSARWGENTLGGNFSAKQLVEGSSGVGYLSLALIKSPEGATLSGTVQWPDGTVQAVRGVKVVEEKKEDAKSDSNKLDSGKPDVDKKEAEKKDEPKKEEAKPEEKTEAVQPERGRRGGRGPGERVPGERSGPAGSGRGDAPAATANSESKDSAKKDATIYSNVRYPFSSFGRNGLPEQPEVVVIQNTTIWTCGHSRSSQKCGSGRSQGNDQAMGSNLPVPAGAIVIDGSKLQLTPGLIDCHSHMATNSR
ncbi:MAG: amidohydrolase family protein [Pirellulales bacterium]